MPCLVKGAALVVYYFAVSPCRTEFGGGKRKRKSNAVLFKRGISSI